MLEGTDEHLSEALCQFMSRCGVRNDGFIAVSDSSGWRLGTVLMARRGDEFITVQKAAADNGAYEFGGLIALPGGMVRGRDVMGSDAGSDIAALSQESLRARAKNEAGVCIGSRLSLEFANLGPVVSSYTAKGKKRFTLIVAQTMSLMERFALSDGDHTVSGSQWSGLQMDWSRLAPANCVVIGHLLWPCLSGKMREMVKADIENAVSHSNEWAESIGLPSVPNPWAPKDRLDTWLSSWAQIN